MRRRFQILIEGTIEDQLEGEERPQTKEELEEVIDDSFPVDLGAGVEIDERTIIVIMNEEVEVDGNDDLGPGGQR